MITTILTIIIIVALMIGANALYVAGEFAAVSARKTRIIQMAEDGNRLAKIFLPVLDDHHKLDNYIAASQVGITISSLMLGIYGQQQIAPLLTPFLEQLPFNSLPFLGEMAGTGVSAIVVLLFLTTLQVVLGELVPKSLALQYPEQVALLTALPMKWSADYVLKPLIIILNGSGAIILKVLGITYGGGHAHVHSPEEIEILVSESHEGGLLDAEERQLLHNAFRIGELTAGEIMIPRTRIVSTAMNTPLHEILELAAQSSYSRIPLYQEDIDHIMGFVHLKDLFRLQYTNQADKFDSIIRKVPHVPKTMPAIDVWNKLNSTQSYIAIVFDEYGGTAGMITQEDLMEELFGEVQDEFDEETALIARAEDGQVIVRGDMLTDMLGELLRIDLPHEASNTVGGMLLEQLGRVPKVGDQVELSGIDFRVEAITGRSVSQVSLKMQASMAEALEETS